MLHHTAELMATASAFTPEQVAAAAKVPVDAVRRNLPLIEQALAEQGIGDRPTVIAAIGTTAIETASTFEPIHEFESPHWDTYSGGRQFHGRGFIQLTHDYNYRAAGLALGLDLVGNPDLALEPRTAARVLAWYFKTVRGKTSGMNVSDAARAGDWRKVRLLVLGAEMGWKRLADVAAKLGGHPVADNTATILARVVELARQEIGKPYSGPIVGQPDSARRGDPGWDCSSFVEGMYERATGANLFSWAYTDTMANECTWLQDPIPGCIVFYHYPDSSQPNTFWPHVGLWLSPTETLDCRFGKGVGVHPHVTPVQQGDRFRRTMLPKKLAGQPAPGPAPIPGGQVDPIQALRERVGQLETALAHMCDVVAADRALAIADEAQRIREEFLGPRPKPAAAPRSRRARRPKPTPR